MADKKANKSDKSERRHGRKWTFDLAAASKALSVRSSKGALGAPMGWSQLEETSDGSVTKKDDLAALKTSMAMEIAMGQGRSLMMNMFMMWMSGNSIHIMPIMFTGMAIMAPITAISNINQAFVKFHDVDVTLAKLLYIVINILGLLAGMYKCSSLGLLPTKPADWLQLEQIQPAMQFSGGGEPLVF
eukprot:TRINITY_DN4529_c0_g1_i4.p1 TRINITY_DN4529_c0_g1~~TRINITY_DN4529_c0_g1_i4.p1  ORF type:complete len:187 (+),score=48.94 TRINITY_DN4529_c0_g1_i4:187-747(+)